MEEQEKKTEEQQKKIEEKLEKQEKKLEKQEKTVEKQEKKMEEQEKKMEEQEKKMEEQEKKIKEKAKKKMEEHKKKAEKQEKKIEEQEKKMEEQERKVKEQEKVLEEQENTLQELSNTLVKQKEIVQEEQEQKLEEQKQVLQEQFSGNFKDLEQKYQELLTKSDQAEASDLTNIMVGTRRTFEMKHFSRYIAKDNWKSPAMNTHVCGYKLCIGVGTFMTGDVYAEMFAMPGEFDGQLKWPARAEFSIELVNRRGGENATCISQTWMWDKPVEVHKTLGYFGRVNTRTLLHHSELSDFLVDDSLHFIISNIKLL